MTEVDVETILQRAGERFPDARPRIISDNGPQFIAKEFIRICGMTHVRTSPYYPQSNIKRLHNSIGYVTPADKLTGRDLAIFADRKRKLEAARERSRLARATRCAGE